MLSLTTPGNLAGVAGKLLKALKTGARRLGPNRLVVCEVPEPRTSQTCSSFACRARHTQAHQQQFNLVPVDNPACATQ